MCVYKYVLQLQIFAQVSLSLCRSQIHAIAAIAKQTHHFDARLLEYLHERPSKSPTIINVRPGHWYLILSWNSYEQEGLHIYKKQWLLICLPDFWSWRHSSSKFISVRNEAFQMCCSKSKKIIHKMNTPQNIESESSSQGWPKRWPNDDHFLGFWASTDTSPLRALKWLPRW